MEEEDLVDVDAIDDDEPQVRGSAQHVATEVQTLGLACATVMRLLGCAWIPSQPSASRLDAACACLDSTSWHHKSWPELLVPGRTTRIVADIVCSPWLQYAPDLRRFAVCWQSRFIMGTTGWGRPLLLCLLTAAAPHHHLDHRSLMAFLPPDLQVNAAAALVEGAPAGRRSVSAAPEGGSPHKSGGAQRVHATTAKEQEELLEKLREYVEKRGVRVHVGGRAEGVGRGAVLFCEPSVIMQQW